MTATQCLSALCARWRQLALLAGSMFALALLLAVLQPPRYTATAEVLIDFKPDPVSALAFGGMAPPAFMATQLELLRSERVASRVVEQADLMRSAEWAERWRDETGGKVPLQRWLVQALGERLRVQVARDSGVIAISYTAPSAEQASLLANGFMQAYIEVAQDIRTEPARQFSRFFEARAKAADRTLKDALARLSTFNSANGIVAADERLDVETARLSELSSQLTSVQSLSSESASRQSVAQGGRADRLPEALNNPMLSQLSAEISRAEAQLQVLSTRLGDKHPQLVEAQAELAQLRNRSAEQTQKVAGSVGVANSINRQRQGDVRSALSEQRVRVLKMKALRDQALVLQSDVDNARRAYDALQQRLTQASLESQNAPGNINVLQRALQPLQPSSPQLWLHAALGLLLGGLVAVGMALGLELRDRRVRTPGDLVAATGMTLLGELPLRGSHAAVPTAWSSAPKVLSPLPSSPEARVLTLQRVDFAERAMGHAPALPRQGRIGEILVGLQRLTPEQVERILRQQTQSGLRFGEAAIALGCVEQQDVLMALSQQFHYPMLPLGAQEMSAELVALHEPFGSRAESFRALRSQISMRLAASSQPPCALAVISAQAGDGRSYCASNLAVALAQLGGRTLLVDADLRKPRLHEMFGVQANSGLSSALAGRADGEVILPLPGVAGLYLLPAGAPAPNPLELVERPSFASMMQELASRFTHVVVDTPAASHGADAAVIAAGCGSALLMARRDTSTVAGVQQLIASFSASRARAVGVVFNAY
jgi:polysaccharide biosynthesis transport protein